MHLLVVQNMKDFITVCKARFFGDYFSYTFVYCKHFYQFYTFTLLGMYEVLYGLTWKKLHSKC